METVRQFLRKRRWLAFFVHQLLILALAFGFLNLVRAVSGRTIHGGREPVGLLDGIGLVLLSIGVIVFTVFFYRRIKDENAPALGIELSVRRFIEFIAGLLVGFVFVITPYLTAVYNRRLFVVDSITAHSDVFPALQIIAVAFILLLVQAVAEETANRAFPLRLWENRPLFFRLLVPSVFFALLHLADENLSFERPAVLIVAGAVQTLAYLLTGNIWLTSGIHTGANAASFSVTGLWYAGAVVALAGASPYPNWTAIAALLVLMSVLYAVSRSAHKKTRL